MLALSPDFERSRVWVQNRLWSDRGSGQAAASLRQDLSELRKALGASAEALFTADRQSVRLSRESVWVDLLDDTQLALNVRDLLEGLRVRDPAFRTWLTEERKSILGLASHRTKTRPISDAGAAVLLSAAGDGSAADLAASSFLDTVAQGLMERTSLDIRFARPEKISAAVELIAESLSASQHTALRVKLEDGATGRAMWSRSETPFACGASPPVAQNDRLLTLANETTEQLAHFFLERWRRGQLPLDATVACQLAIGKLFTFDPGEQDKADRLFEYAYEQDPRGLYLAWRVLLRVIRIIELHDEDLDRTEEEIAAYSEKARELEPQNSMVLAAASNAAMLITGDMLAARELSDRSLAVNPANPFAWDCQSIWHLLSGQFERAHALQLRARAIAGDPRCKHWWDMGCALTATVTGRFDEARHFAESAAALVPNFRPPLRYLTALYANEGREEAALDVMTRLQRIEPDFSVLRMVEDPGYPSAALKRSSLANRDLARRMS
jgi:tetratricopeptide (TPR) repeat protein